MKKYLALVLGVLFVLSFAASAFAIHAEIPSETQAVVAKGGTQITLGGEIRVRGWMKTNILSEGFGPFSFKLPTDITNDATSTNSYYDQRVRLSLDAKVTPNVEGYVMLESGGGSNTSDVYTWGNFNSKPDDLRINEAWILYTGSGLFGFNSGLKVGHMPLALGNKQFFDHTKFGDDAIVFFMDPIKQLHIGLLSIKFSEAFATNGDATDDLDGYVALMTYKINDKNTVGVNYTYLSHDDLGFTHQNLGLHANGNVAGLGYKAEVDMQFGKVKALDQKFKGYAVMAGLDYNLNPVTLRGSFGMGSGANEIDDNKVKEFIPYLGNDQHYTLVYEYQVSTAALSPSLLGVGGTTNTGLANTTYYNVGVDFAASKDLTASIDGYLLRATKTSLHEQISGDTVSKKLGWEVDAKIKYALAKNLTYQVDAGYFKSGQFYEDFFGLDREGVTVLRHMLTLSF
jgi:hypothetical protein